MFLLSRDLPYRIARNIMPAIIARPPIAAPTPIPALAPVLRSEVEGAGVEGGDVVGDDAAGDEDGNVPCEIVVEAAAESVVEDNVVLIVSEERVEM